MSKQKMLENLIALLSRIDTSSGCLATRMQDGTCEYISCGECVYNNNTFNETKEILLKPAQLEGKCVDE